MHFMGHHGHRGQHGCDPRDFARAARFAMRGARFGFDGLEDAGFGGFGGRGGHRGGGRRRMFDSGQLRLVLLKLIADEPRHGYDLIRAIEEMTGGGYAPSPGTVYPTLTLLEDMGLVSATESEAGRKVFTATEAGTALLAEREEEIAGLIERLQHHGERRSRADRAPLKRAMHGLRTALWSSVAGGELADDKVHAIADIIDEATRKIERLR
jgi:DNA-binding PadR family transcriptional regulator